MTRMLNHMPASFLVLNNDKRKIYWLYQGSCPSLLIFYMKLTPIYPRCKMFISIKQTIFTWWISTGESYIGAIIKALLHLIIIDIPTLFEIILDCKLFFLLCYVCLRCCCPSGGTNVSKQLFLF